MTEFETIYNRFSQKITDYKLLQLDDVSLSELLLGWLHSSIAKFRICKSDLSDRDDDSERFNIDLTDLEIEILALRMVDEWLEPQLNSVLLTKQFMGGNTEKFFSQAGHLNELRLLSDRNRKEIRQLENRYRIVNNTYIGKEED